MNVFCEPGTRYRVLFASGQGITLVDAGDGVVVVVAVEDVLVVDGVGDGELSLALAPLSRFRRFI